MTSDLLSSVEEFEDYCLRTFKCSLHGDLFPYSLKVTMFAVANRNVHLLNSLSGAASPLPLGSPSVCFS